MLVSRAPWPFLPHLGQLLFVPPSTRLVRKTRSLWSAPSCLTCVHGVSCPWHLQTVWFSQAFGLKYSEIEPYLALQNMFRRHTPSRVSFVSLRAWRLSQIPAPPLICPLPSDGGCLLRWVSSPSILCDAGYGDVDVLRRHGGVYGRSVLSEGTYVHNRLRRGCSLFGVRPASDCRGCARGQAKRELHRW